MNLTFFWFAKVNERIHQHFVSFRKKKKKKS